MSDQPIRPCKLCDSPLSRYNRGSLCSDCERAKRDLNFGGSLNGVVARVASAVVKRYVEWQVHQSDQSYADHLSEKLDELCGLLGVKIPNLEEAVERWMQVPGGRGCCAACGEVSGPAPRPSGATLRRVS